MDTGTHLVVGFGLAGLAYIDPVVASDSATATAVLLGTVLGSQAPDSDGLLRLRGNAVYIRNHRGKSHSLPAIVLWSLLLTTVLGFIFPAASWWHLALWTTIAVSFHVFSDLFNTYGTQAARPFTSKWISWNIIHIFDPFIFVSHLAAIFIWSVKLAQPQVIFPILYSVIALYYIWRTAAHAVAERSMPRRDPGYKPGDRYMLIPTINLYIWNIVKQKTDGSYELGELRHGQVRWIDKVRPHSHPAIEASRNHPDIKAFLYFSSHACAEYKEHPWGYEVRWADVRYRHRKQYPCVGVLIMDRDLNPLDTYVGWLSETRLEKRLRMDSY
ncbi:metal-dependent hydrolase [Paenibacillus sp. y28]|uniref:metal-dependent hydrolase n=1 Tax=Paenibacillus sp. y28 TaxID=3129110 RepID=UPI0030172ABC